MGRLFYTTFGEESAWAHIAAALSVSSLEVQPATNGDVPPGPGIVVFSELSPALAEFIRDASRLGRELIVAVACSAGSATVEDCWTLLENGARDVLFWRDGETAACLAARFERWQRVEDILASPLVRENLAGSSPAWVKALREAVEIACFSDAPLLITGETGTGKELVARMVHTLDGRPGKRALVVLDCTTVVAELSGSEFFGHERGAFTGAVSRRDGAFTLADGGTLFLDEVGELPLTLQPQLLRAVQEGAYKRVGGNEWRRASFRLICATNRNLKEETEEGRFRADFFHRIASCRCHLPPLRERPGDILPLARHFLRQFRPDMEADFDPAVQQALCERDYPGNVRELRQLVAQMAARHAGGGPLTAGDVPPGRRLPSCALADWRDLTFETCVRKALAQGAGLKEIGRAAQETAERLVLEEEGGNLQRAASRLQVTDRALQLRRASRRAGCP